MFSCLWYSNSLSLQEPLLQSNKELYSFWKDTSKAKNHSNWAMQSKEKLSAFRLHFLTKLLWHSHWLPSMRLALVEMRQVQVMQNWWGASLLHSSSLLLAPPSPHTHTILAKWLLPDWSISITRTSSDSREHQLCHWKQKQPASPIEKTNKIRIATMGKPLKSVTPECAYLIQQLIGCSQIFGSWHEALATLAAAASKGMNDP